MPEVNPERVKVPFTAAVPDEVVRAVQVEPLSVLYANVLLYAPPSAAVEYEIVALVGVRLDTATVGAAGNVVAVASDEYDDQPPVFFALER